MLCLTCTNLKKVGFSKVFRSDVAKLKLIVQGIATRVYIYTAITAIT